MNANDWSAIRTKVLRFCKNDEDVCQEIMTKLFEMPEKQKGKQFNAWLYVMCRNACRDKFRQREPTCELNEDFDQQPDMMDGLAIDWELLTPEQRDIANWLMEGYTYDEIAERLSISTDALKKRLRRIRQKNSLS